METSYYLIDLALSDYVDLARTDRCNFLIGLEPRLVS